MSSPPSPRFHRLTATLPGNPHISARCPLLFHRPHHYPVNFISTHYCPPCSTTYVYRFTDGRSSGFWDSVWDRSHPALPCKHSLNIVREYYDRWITCWACDNSQLTASPEEEDWCQDCGFGGLASCGEVKWIKFDEENKPGEDVTVDMDELEKKWERERREREERREGRGRAAVEIVVRENGSGK